MRNERGRRAYKRRVLWRARVVDKQINEAASARRGHGLDDALPHVLGPLGRVDVVHADQRLEHAERNAKALRGLELVLEIARGLALDE